MAITDSLNGYWDLSEASGTRNDSTANVNHLTDNNTVTGTTGPGSHNASLFTSTNSETLSVNNNASLQLGDFDFTIAVWCKLTTEVDGQVLVAVTTSSDLARAYAIYYDSTNHKFNVWVSNTGANQVFIAGVNSSFDTTNWHYVIFWHDSVNNFIRLQVDNGSVSQTSHTLGIFASTGPLRFGGEKATSSCLNGACAMAGFWKRVLTDPEKTFLYNGGSGLSYAEMTAVPEMIAVYSDDLFPKPFLRRPLTAGRLI